MDQKFHLDLAPVNFSLTEGTSIPAPPDSPPLTPQSHPNNVARPPTPGGGPLSSHPATPSETPGTPKLAATQISSIPAIRKISNPPPPPAKPQTTTTVTANRNPPPQKKSRPSSVRKFLGLRSLNPSHMKSSDSLNSNATAPTVVSTGRTSNTTSDNRPLSPNTRSLRRKSSASWFGKRASGFFGAMPLDDVVEAGAVGNTEKENGEVKPVKKGPPPPKLPELKSFGIAEDEGSLGGDLFKDIK